ncbi:MAG: dihydroorotate dehydrogenase-like protein [Gammaproteobacteria bacterium]|nr:dihydroorotate dehydrogenase-like protein [Gammaproteobacteria bacterium]
MDMSTEYLGLKLKNPLVPSSSPVTKNIDSAKQCEDAGASALVMHSLFEEEIEQDEQIIERLYEQDIGHGEASAYLPSDLSESCYLDDYLAYLNQLKMSLDIPIIASLNATSMSGWSEHAIELEQSGADALELNVYYIAADIDEKGSEVEERYIQLLMDVKQKVNIPITMKLSPQFSSPANMVRRLQFAGADGVSLFNRFYQASIDLETLGVSEQLNLSTSADSLLAMRWLAILYGRVDLSLAATGGVHNSHDAIRMLLAGADVVHMAAALLTKGPQYLAEVLEGIQQWMVENEYDSVTQLKGSVSQKNIKIPSQYERANYMNILKNFS